MNLPIRLEYAEKLVDEYNTSLNDFINNGIQTNKQKLTTYLEGLRNSLEQNALEMYRGMGYDKGNLAAREKALNDNLKRLRNEAKALSAFNGPELYNAFIKEVQNIQPVKKQYQEKWQRYIYNLLSGKGVNIGADLNTAIEDLLIKEGGMEIYESIVKDVFEKVSVSIGKDNSKDYKLKFRNDGKIRGFSQKGSTPLFKLTQDFALIGNTMRKKLEKVIDSLDVEEGSGEDINIVVGIKEDNWMKFLKLKTTHQGNNDADIPTISDDEANKVMEKFKEFIKKNMTSGADNKKILEECIDKVFSTIQKNKIYSEIFAGENAPRKLTGMLGEIQTMYLIKNLVKNESYTTWTAASSNGVQQHADLVMTLPDIGKHYGIQVKNSTREFSNIGGINFESFLTGKGSNAAISNIGLNLSLTKTDYGNELEDIMSVFAMDSFNIPYKWTEGEAVRVGVNEKFADVRNKINNLVRVANTAVTRYIASMMYMQTSNSLAKVEGVFQADSNSLYIISGQEIISAATIITKMLKRVEKALDNSNQMENSPFAIKMKARIDKKESDYTIIDFLNSPKGQHTNKQFIMRSSFNFSEL